MKIKLVFETKRILIVYEVKKLEKVVLNLEILKIHFKPLSMMYQKLNHSLQNIFSQILIIHKLKFHE